jgi:hypothetical protein
MRPRLGIVDVVGEDPLPARGRGQRRAIGLVEIRELAGHLPADGIVGAEGFEGPERGPRRHTITRGDQQPAETEARRAVVWMLFEVIAQGDGRRR